MATPTTLRASYTDVRLMITSEGIQKSSLEEIVFKLFNENPEILQRIPKWKQGDWYQLQVTAKGILPVELIKELAVKYLISH